MFGNTTLYVPITTYASQNDELVERLARETGADLRGVSSGGSQRIYYFKANDEQMSEMIRLLKEQGVEGRLDPK